MKNALVVRLLSLAAIASLSACQCGPSEGAMQVVVNIDAAVPGSCVVLEVSAGGAVKLSKELARTAGKDSFRLGLKQGDLPSAVTLTARSFTPKTGEGCASPRVLTSASAPVDALFPRTGVETKTVEIHAPGLTLDADADTHVDLAKGGDDCNDQEASIRPGVAALCTGTVDNDCDGQAACADSECSALAICNTAAASLAYVTTASPVVQGDCSAALTVELRDTNGNPIAAFSNTVAALTASTTGVSFFSDPACTTAATATTLATGEQRKSFYFRATTPGTFDAVASAAGLAPATQAQTVTARQVAQLAFTTPPRTVVSGACSAELRLETRDAAGNVTPVLAASSIALSSSQTGVTFFSDAACASAITSLPLALGATTGAFYVKATVTLATTLTATLSGVPAVSQALTVTASAPATLAFSTAAQGIQAGACSSVVTVEVRDANGNPSPVAATTTVSLATTGVAISLFSNAGCTAAASNSLTLSAGTSSGSFYFQGSVVGTATITASATGLTSAMQTQSIGVGPPSQLVFTTAARTAGAGQCSAIVSVQAQDSSGNPSNVTGAPLAVTIAGPASGFSLFTDASCTAPLTSASIAVGASTTSFYFRGTVAGVHPVSVSATGVTGATQNETITAGAATALVFTSAPQTQPANVCAQFNLEARDSFGNPSAPTAGATANLTATGAFTFSAAAGCGTAATSVTFTGATATFFGRSTVAGSKTLTATATFGVATQTFVVTPLAPSRLVVTTPARTVVVGGCSGLVTVQAQDSFNNPSAAATNLPIALTHNGSASFRFHTGATCANPVTSITLAGGQSSIDVFFTSTQAEAVTMTFTATGLTAASQLGTVATDVASKLVFTTAPQTITAGGCTAIITVQQQDSLNNPVAQAATVNLSATATAGLTFHTASGCSGASAVTSVSIGAAATSASFYVKANKAEAVTLTAAAATLTDATQALTVNPGAATKLVFTTAPQTIAAGGCTAILTVQRQDALNNPTTTGALTVNLTSSATSGLTFNTASDCTGPTTSVSIAAGASSASFYVRATKVEAVTLTAAGTAVTNATQVLTVNPDVASKLVFTTAPQTITAGTCTAAVTVQRQDAANNPVTIGGLTVALTSTATVGLTFHTTCGGAAITSVDIVAGASSASFFVRATRVEAVNLIGAGGGLTDATQALTINAAAASKLVFTSPVQTVAAGACSALVSVQRQDAFDNPVTGGGALTVNLTSNATSGLTFNSNAACSTGTTSVSIAGGASSASFYVRSTRAETVTMTAAGGTLANGTQALIIDPAPATKLVFTTAPQTIVVSTCTAIMTVQQQDAFNNPVTGAATVNLASSAATGLTFHAAAGCGTAAITTIDILAGASSASFYVRATQVESVTLTASSGTLTNATQVLTVNSASANKLVFTTAPQTITAGGCTAILTVQQQDSFNNPVNGAATVNLSSTSSGGLTFHTASNCSGGSTVTSVAITAGNSSASFYVKANRAETVTLTAAAATLTDATQTLIVNPGAASKLVFTTAPQTILAGGCTAILTVQRQDALNNPATAGALTVNLTSNASAGLTFNTASDCTGATSSLSIAAGASSASFYVRATVAESVTLTAAGSGVTSANQSLTVNTDVAAKLVFTTAPQTIVAGLCTAIVTVQRQDAANNPVTAGGLLTVNLTSTATAGLTFHAGAGCGGGTITSVDIAAAASSASFYVRATKVEAVTLTGAGGGLTAATQALTITAAAGTKLVFITAPQTIVAGSCSALITVQRQDQFDNPVTPGASLTVNLTSTSGLTFNSNASCSAGVTSVSIPASASSASFYVRATKAETVTLTGAGGTLTSANQALIIDPDVATKLVFTTAPQTIAAGACTAILTVQRQDAFNNPTTAGALSVGLTSNASSGLTFNTNSDCTGPITSLSLAAGVSSGSFYVRATQVESVTLTAAGGGLASANQVLTVNTAAATKLVFTTAPQSIVAGACTAIVTVQRQDTLNNPVTTGGALTVNLTSDATAGLTFHAAAGCGGGAITSVDILASNSAAGFYVRATKVEPVNITGAGGGLTNATQALTVTPGAATKLGFSTPPQTITAGACSAIVTVQRQDAFDNPVTGGALTVNLTAGSGSVVFNSNAACSAGIGSVSIAGGTSSASFYVRDNVAETTSFTATATGLTAANQVLTVVADVATKLVFTTAPQSIVAGACTAIVTVQRQDALNNPVTLGGALTVNLTSTATAGLSFHTVAGCGSGATTSVNIAAATSSASFYVRATKVEAVTFTAAGGTLTSANQALTITPDVASKLVFTTPPQTLIAGTCSAVVTVQRQDQFNNPITTGGALTVNLTSTASSGLTFNTSGTCGTTTTSVSIASGASSASFFVRATKAESVTLTGAGGTLTNATQVLVVNPAAATQLVFSTAAQTILANACSAVTTVVQQDQFGNPAPASSAVTVTLTDDGTGLDFFLGSACNTGAVGSATIAAGTSSTSFYFRSTVAASVTITAAASGLTNATQVETINPDSSKLVFTTPARTITAGACSSVLTVQRQDGLNNPVTGGGPLAVNLSSTATTGLTFYSDPACTTAVTLVTISGGASAADFYVSATVAETVTLTAAGGTLISATQSFTTTVGAPSKLVFTSPAPQTLPALDCSALTTVTLQDSSGNAANALVAVTVTFSAAPAGPNVTFFTDATCTTSMTANQRTMTIGTSTVTLYFKAENAGAATLTAAAATLTSGNQAATFTAATPTQLVFTTAAPTVEAGFCQALTLERRDVSNRPTSPTSATTVTLANSPAGTGILYFTDSACTTALGASFDIAASTSSTVVYVKGISGSLSGNIPGSQIYGLTASSAPLTAGTLNVTVLPMVRRGSCSLTGASITCAVSPTLATIDRTMLVFQASATEDDTPSDDMVTCRMVPNGGVAQVICERVGTGSNVAISWETVSFAYSAANGGVSVQHLSTPCTAMPQNIAVPTASTRGTSFVLFSHRGEGALLDSNETYMAQMTSDTNVQVAFAADGTFGGAVMPNTVFETQVVNWANSNVARGVASGGSATTFTVAQATANVGRAFLLHSSRMAQIAETGNTICDRRLSGVITDATGFSFQRGCNTSGHDIGNISWERVELPANATVQQATPAIADTATSTTATIASVDRTRAFAFAGGQGPGGSANGRTNRNSTSRIGSSQANVNFTSATQLTLNRITNNAAGNWGVFVVEVTP